MQLRCIQLHSEYDTTESTAYLVPKRTTPMESVRGRERRPIHALHSQQEAVENASQLPLVTHFPLIIVRRHVDLALGRVSHVAMDRHVHRCDLRPVYILASMEKRPFPV